METATKVRMKASDFPQEVLDLFDLFIHGDIGRREFLDRAGKFAAGTMTAAVMLELLAPEYSWAQQVQPNDTRIKAEYVTYPSTMGNATDGKMKGYLARPARAAGKLPAILVVHENRGLNPYIEDVARRFAVANFLAFAPDALTPLGGYPAATTGDAAARETAATAMFQKLNGMKTPEDFAAAVVFLKSHPESTGKVGVVGFCFGGGIANQMAVRFPDLGAAVAYYGAQPTAADAAKIKAPVMIHNGALDARITGGSPAYEAALKAAGVKYEAFTYENANHGFHNDTTPRYDKAAAETSWQRTVDFFNKNLRS